MTSLLVKTLYLFSAVTLAASWIFPSWGQADVMPTRSKVDCNMPKEDRLEYFRRYNLPEGTDKILPGCPGYDDHDPGFANFDVNGLKLRIPRDVLALDQREEADGPVSGVRLIFTVPSFESESDSTINEIIKTAIFTALSSDQDCVDDDCYSFLEVEFFKLVSGLGVYAKSVDAIIAAREIVQNSTKTYGPLKYRLIERDQYSAVFRAKDGIIFEWFFCDNSTESCRSIYQYEDKMLIYLNFSKINVGQMISYKNLFEAEFMSRIIVRDK